MRRWIDVVAARQPKCCDVRAESDGGTVRLDIDGPIGWDGISASEVVLALKAHASASQIDVHLSSPGGSAFDGVQIYNNLRRHPAKVRIMVDGYAASAGSIIAMAGDETIMGKGSMMMVHNARGTVLAGSAEDMLVAADLLGKSNVSMASIYAGRAGGSVDGWLQVMKGEQWYTAEEAVEAGLADRVEDFSTPTVDATDVAAIAEIGVSMFGWRWPGREGAPAPSPVPSLVAETVAEPATPENAETMLQALLVDHPIAQLTAMLADTKGTR